MKATTPDRPRSRPNWSLWVGIAAAAALTWWSADRIGLRFGSLFANLGRGGRYLSELASPDWSFVVRVWDAWLETLSIAIVASAVGNGVALVLALLASRVTSANSVVSHVVRTVLSVVRSLPDVAYALVFVAAVGTGALGGILALIMFNIGVNAKLTAETIDAVDTGPVEAADAAGANRVQRAWVAVVPQILPSYVSYSLYVFEVNLRASVVIGLVGGGGIGFVIATQLARGIDGYADLGAVVAALFVVVFALDRLSMWIRGRLV